MKFSAIAVGMLTLVSLVSGSSLRQPAPAALVANSHAPETAKHIALVDPHYPVNIAGEAVTLFGDVNAARAARGIAPLVRDETLDRFAYAKAVEMAARGYFGHTDPDGITFNDRMSAWHWPTKYTAENIAFDRDETRAHTAFMNSPPHAENLLDPHEKRIGVAVVSVGDGETFYVEDFSGN